MKIYVVTKIYADPRYTLVKGIYQAAFSTVDEARNYVESSIKEDACFLNSVVTGEFTRDDGTVFIECINRSRNQYYCFAIYEEEV